MVLTVVYVVAAVLVGWVSPIDAVLWLVVIYILPVVARLLTRPKTLGPIIIDSDRIRLPHNGASRRCSEIRFSEITSAYVGGKAKKLRLYIATRKWLFTLRLDRFEKPTLGATLPATLEERIASLPHAAAQLIKSICGYRLRGK